MYRVTGWAAFALCACASGCGTGTQDSAPVGAPPSVAAPALDTVPDAGACDSIVAGGGGAEWRIESACTGCTPGDTAAIVDNDLTTYGELQLADATNRTGAAVLRLTAAPGTVLPAGNAVYVLIGATGTTLSTAYTITTLRSGAVAESVSFPRDVYVNPDDTDDSLNYLSVATTQPFDAVEVTFPVVASRDDARLLVREVCNNVYGERPS